MIEVRKIPMAKILKLDLRILLEDTISILESYNPEALQLQDLCMVLKRQEIKMRIINNPYGQHHLTSTLTKLNKKRLRYASLIHTHVDALENVDNEKTQKMAAIAKSLAKEHLTYLGQKTKSEVDILISSFFSRLETVYFAEDREAFAGLGLQAYLDELEKTNRQFKEIYSQRTLDIKQRPPTGDRALEKETRRILQLFYDQVNYYQQTFTEIDYEPFIKELNVVLTENSKSIKTRLATNKRRARKKAAAAAKEAAAKAESTTALKLVTTDEAKPSADTPDAPVANSGKDIPIEDKMKVIKLKSKRKKRK